MMILLLACYRFPASLRPLRAHHWHLSAYHASTTGLCSAHAAPAHYGHGLGRASCRPKRREAGGWVGAEGRLGAASEGALDQFGQKLARCLPSLLRIDHTRPHVGRL